MAISFRAQTQIASGGATDPTSAPTIPTGTTTGDMVLLFVIVKYGDVRTINTPTSWTALSNGNVANSGLASGNDAGNVRAAIFWREKDAGWSTMPAVDLDAAPNCSMVGAITYQKGGGDTWATPAGASIADNTEAAAGVVTGNAATTLSLATGDLLGSFCAQNGDAGTFSAHTCAVTGVTFGGQTARLAAATSSGTDLRGHSIEQPYSSGTASTGPAGSMTLTGGAATTAGVFVFYRLSLSGGAANPAPAVTVTTVTLPAATVTASAQTTQTTIARSVVMPAASAVEMVSATPATVARAFALPAATVTASVQKTPAATATTVTLPGATVTASASKTPAAVASVIALPAATVTASAQKTPATILAVVAIPQATPVDSGGGAASATPATIARSFALPAATVTASASTTPAVIVAAAALPAATVTASAQTTQTTIVATVTLPQATATDSGVGASPSPAVIAATLALPAPAVTVDAVIAAEVIVATVAILAVTITGPIPPVITPTVGPSVRPVGVGFPEASDWGEVVEWVAYLNESRY